ncbi:G protein-coupled receptor 158a isoform X2 [Gouania willdenowi]|uniref:G-protein coupled receptors family 3 profile domain-containing protein n=1 Tax=Gouania willdenowi TaxID=441366 RepID=A0A8C5HTD6_GOUWI|nr:probable G-protein coupled receptor 158 isoform X2 [Gouania willdenowi]
MAVFRLSLLLQVGFVIGSYHNYAQWSAHGKDARAIYAQTHRRQPAHLRSASESPHHTEEEYIPRVVTAFLHTGDPGTLKQANCSRKYELTSLRGRSHSTPHQSMRSVLNTVLHATNFLNMILQTNRSREQSLRRDIEWYQALVRSILEGDAKIYRAVVSFNGNSSLPGPQVLLQATRAEGEIVIQDLSSMAHKRLHNRTVDTEWYHEVKNKKNSGVHRRVVGQDKSDPVKHESLFPDNTHVRWSAPYLECDNGNYVPRWLLTLSAAFYGLKSNLATEFRGVVRVDINLQDVDIDQCSSDGWFAETHRCNLTTMECLPIQGHGFVLDKYKCHCKTGFYHPNRVAVNGFARTGKKRKAMESGPNADEGSSNNCLPCQQGCVYCKDDTPCVAREDSGLRLAVISFQCLCMLIVFISMVLIYHFRRNKSIRASGLTLLEAILCGALLLYFPVGILYFQPSVFRCILLRWVRLLGFATVYGTLTLKLYRVLKVFLSRTAQRIPYMTSWHVLRLLGIILLITCWFLVAWTSAVCQNPDRKLALIDVGYTPDGLQFSLCLLDRWDYMMAVAEFLFLLWAVYLCYAVRTVPSAFHEPRYMAIAVHNELILSAIFYVIRFTLASELHPDWMLLLFFTHTQLTVTITLGLLLIPKFLFAGTHMREDIASEAYEDELDMGRSGSYLNSSITSAWSEHSLDPEDIREELKKLYSQLEIYKRKKMLANNPHLQKKRSSKKGLGRSLMRRITEIPESVHRQCSREDKDIGEHGSNRNSINSMMKKNALDTSNPGKQAKEDTLKNKVFSLKKSHSSYDHVRDKDEDTSLSEKIEVATAEGSLLDTLMGKKLVKKKSNENISVPSESTESVPLVCKSASAHNLTADKKLIHPRASMLQKSLSVIASAKEKTLGLTGKIQSTEDSSRKSQPKSQDTKANAEQEDECQSRIPQLSELSSTTKISVLKQPGSSLQPTACSDPVKGKDLYDLSEVCPWEVEDVPTPSENKVQKHVSIAPEETITIHGASSKGSKHHQQKQKPAEESSSSSKNLKEIYKKTAVRAEVCPWEDSGEGQESLKEGSKQLTCSTSKFQQPLSAVESSKSSWVDVCPWDFEETQKTTEFARSPDTIKQTGGGSPVDGRRKSILSDSPKVGATLQPSKADVCPWDYDSPAVSPNTERTPSPSKISRTKESPSKKKSIPTPRTIDKSNDTDDTGNRTKAKDKILSTEKAMSKQTKAEVGPWNAEIHKEEAIVEIRKSTNVGSAKAKPTDVCPWDFDDTSDKKSTDKSFPVVKQSSPTSAANKADVCPWDFEESTSSKKA